MRDAFRISTWSLSGGFVFKTSAQLVAFAILLLAVIKQRCITPSGLGVNRLYSLSGIMHRTERSVTWRFGTNTCTVPPLILSHQSSLLDTKKKRHNISISIHVWEQEGHKWHFWWNVYIYIYIYQMKALNELFLLAKVLSFMSVQICITNNNWNQYTKSDQTMEKNKCFGSPVKLVKCHLRPSGSHTLDIQNQTGKCGVC